jgi:hypothetical protein
VLKKTSTPWLRADPSYLLEVNRLMGRFTPVQLALYVVRCIVEYNQAMGKAINVTLGEGALACLKQMEE